MTENKVLLIIPAYNEESNILKTVQSIINYNKENHTNFDFIVINDGSTDSTSKICHDNGFPIIDLVHNLGIGGAVQTGYRYAQENGYDIAVQFDGDGQHDVSYVNRIIEPIINKEANMVVGSRFIDKDASIYKSNVIIRFGLRIISLAVKYSTGRRIYDTTSGFRAVDKKLINYFSLSYPVEYPEPITVADVISKEYVIKEVPVSMNARTGGVSSIRGLKHIYYMYSVISAILEIRVRESKYNDENSMVIDDEDNEKTMEYTNNVDEILAKESLVETIESCVKKLENKKNECAYVKSTKFFPIYSFLSIPFTLLTYLAFNIVCAEEVITYFGAVNASLVISCGCLGVTLTMGSFVDSLYYYFRKKTLKLEKIIDLELEYSTRRLAEENEKLDRIRLEQEMVKAEDNLCTLYAVNDKESLGKFRDMLKLCRDYAALLDKYKGQDVNSILENQGGYSSEDIEYVGNLVGQTESDKKLVRK